MAGKKSFKNTKALASGAGLGTPAATHFASPTYHEVTETQSDQVDVLVQMRTHLDHLEDLQGRLHFVMGEICSYASRSD